MNHPEHQNTHNPPSSTRNMSTTTDPIEDAIAALDSQESGEKESYRETSTRFGVNRNTLKRRHTGETKSYVGAA
jgi:hypothetical protein